MQIGGFMNDISYGIIIKNFRIKNGLTQSALGEKIGVGKSTISAYEHNNIIPPTDMFVKICKICNAEILFKTAEKTYTLKEITREY